jgi:hypothetical protein
MWVKLSASDGKPMWINMDAPFAMARVDDHELTRLTVSNDNWCHVRETPEEIMLMIVGRD